MHNPQRLAVVALGGHALNAADALDLHGERLQVQALQNTLEKLAGDGYRLLVVHGNGPQVGRYIHSVRDLAVLDIHIARTQGELGYLISQVLPSPNVCLLTRVRVSNDTLIPTKAIGQLLDHKPEGVPSRAVDGRWQMTVVSPQPLEVVEVQAISNLLQHHHVVAGGGGGIPVKETSNTDTQYHCGVVDKDWTAAMLATELQAELLIFVTNVAGVFRDFASQSDGPESSITVQQAQPLLADQSWGVGSMAPKLQSACRFARERGRPAIICQPDSMLDALQHKAGTVVLP